MPAIRQIYSLRSFDFLIKTIGHDIEMAEELNSLGKDNECEFHVNPFLVGITNGEYIFAVYNNFRSLTSSNFPRAINAGEKAIFYDLLNNSISLFKDYRDSYDFSALDALDCWWLYAVCARNQNLPLWTDAEDKPTRKPHLLSLKKDDWDYIFEIIEEEFFLNLEWLSEIHYRDFPEKEKTPIPSTKEYEDALAWLDMAYSNIWANKSRLLNNKTIADSEKHPDPWRKHEFFDFMKIIKDRIAYEYEMIRSRVSEDPGTAGDQVEESWAAFLRNWLPSNYPVVTKGRLIDSNGSTSPQVDILVLDPSYPLGLRDKKHYFAAGVVAAFECKLTLRKEHLKKFFKNSTLLKRMLEPRKGNPYDELHQLPIYGLLAHSHNWKNTANFKKRIHELISEVEIKFCQHPRELPDLICIADTGTYALHKSAIIGPHADSEDEDLFKDLDKDGGVKTIYIAQTEDFPLPIEPKGEILGMLIFRITQLMAYEDPNLRSYTDYLLLLGIWGGIGKLRLWKKNVLSSEVGQTLIQKGFEDKPWSKWAEDF